MSQLIVSICRLLSYGFFVAHNAAQHPLSKPYAHRRDSPPVGAHNRLWWRCHQRFGPGRRRFKVAQRQSGLLLCCCVMYELSLVCTNKFDFLIVQEVQVQSFRGISFVI